MSNKKNSNRPKDPKKVAAGKARAAKSVRLNGKFVTNYFKEQLSEDAAAVGHTGSLQSFLDQNEIVYSDLYHTAELRSISPKADTTLFKEAAHYTGKLILRIDGEDREVSLDELKYEVLRIEQALMSEDSVAGMSFKPVLTFDGRMIIELPNVDEIDFDEPDAVMMLQESTPGMVIYISSKPKDKKPVNVSGEKQRPTRKERKQKAVKKALKDASKAKGRTKRKGR